MTEVINVLEKKIEEVSKRISDLQDIDCIRKLHHIYGYYFDACLFDEVVDLYAEDSEVRFMGGIFKGKESVRRFFCDRLRVRHTNGHNGPIYGFLLDHIMMQDVITISKDGKTAKGRYRTFMQAGRHELAEGLTRQWWEGGVYENTYVKEDGIWKFKILDYRGLWHADVEKGWAHTPPNLYPFFSEIYPKDPIGPDEILDIVPKPVLWPDTGVLPYHYPHPVTGEEWDQNKNLNTSRGS